MLTSAGELSVFPLCLQKIIIVIIFFFCWPHSSILPRLALLGSSFFHYMKLNMCCRYFKEFTKRSILSCSNHGFGFFAWFLGCSSALMNATILASGLSVFLDSLPVLFWCMNGFQDLVIMSVWCVHIGALIQSKLKLGNV